METALAVFAFAPGLALGSFLNVVAARVPLRRSLVSPGSACMSCGAPIAWYDNLPLLSYVLLRGRCRSCSARIPSTYPLVEAATAVLVSACFLRFGLSGRALVGSLFCAALVTVTVTDIRLRIIPNRIVVPAAVAVLAAQTALRPSPEWAIGALGASLFLFTAAVAYPGGMGMGDVKLALLLGAALGRTVTVALIVAMISALIPSFAILVRHGRAGGKIAIAFGPFLALGGIVALFAGTPILDAYLGRL